MDRKVEVTKLIGRIASILGTFLVVVWVFFIFIEENNNQIAEQNKNFLQSYSQQKAASVSDILDQGAGTVRAMANMYSVFAKSPEYIKLMLSQIEDNSNYDYVRYIDSKGQSYTSSGQVYNVSQRSYFREGIRGRDGISYVEESVINGSSLVCFYAPVRVNNEIVGMLMCAYDMDRIIDLLEGEFYGYPANCILINQKKQVMAVSKGLAGIPDIESFLETTFLYDKETEEKIYSVFETGEPAIVEYTNGGSKTIAYVCQLERTGWIMVQSFPREANTMVTRKANRVGAILLMRMSTIFIIYFVIIALYHGVSFKKEEKKNRYAQYIAQGTRRVFAKFVLLDFESETYQYINSTPTSLDLEEGGTFSQLRDYFTRIICEDSMREAFKIVFTPENLQTTLEKDDRVFNYNVHVMNPTEYWDTISVMAIEHKNGKVTKALVTNQHVTEMKKKEQRDHQALVEALQSAQDANRAKSTFLSNMSHDIRTPMNAIVGFSILLDKDAENPDKVREYTKKIQASSQHLLGLINEVLDMSKIESGKTVLNNQEFSLPEFIEEMENIIIPQMKDNKKQFRIKTKGIVNERLIGDKTRIHQILLNLLSNAMKYTREDGNILLEISQQQSRQDKLYANIHFVVKDNGIGMDEEFQKHIFESFSREINSTTNSIQGTGLGMAITKNLVTLMNGTITVDSKKGVGTTFSVTIPLKVAEEHIDMKGFWEKHHIEKMLVIDDEEDVCLNIRDVMSDTGVEVSYATSGERGLEMVKEAHGKNDYSVILLDYKMPGMDGVETAKLVKQEIGDTVPIVVLTAYEIDEVEEKMSVAGVKCCLPKPFFLSSFCELIEECKHKQEVVKQEEQSENPLNGMHFLVAEDNMLNFHVISALLEMEGASCEHAVNGKEAVSMLEADSEHRIDMILMDVQMPEMNGYEATKKIRALDNSHARQIPIIAMTANAFAEDVAAALDSGMNAHVAKPIDMGRLQETVKNFKKQKN